MEKIKAVFNWSGGKDSAHALLKAMQDGRYDIVALLTTVNRETGCSSMHNLPPVLLERQARAIGIPLYTVGLTPKCGMNDYTAAMDKAVIHFKQLGVTHFIFGDIFLHDVRKYREQQLEPHGLQVVEPLWGKSSEEVMEDFLATGLKTVIVTTMDGQLGEACIGRLIDRDFVRTLPPGIDPNGENGEYHTLCYAGPIFREEVSFTLGSPVRKSFDIRLDDGTVQTYSYWFADIRE